MRPKLLSRCSLYLTVFSTVSAVCLQGFVYGQSADSRPSYSFLRWTEDWSGFERAAASQPDPFDGIKRVSLGASGDVWASFGGDFRVRWEDWSGFNFGLPLAASHDDSFALTRFRLHGDFHLPESNRFFVELKGAYATDRNLPGGVRAIDEDEFELQQFFWDTEIELGGDTPLRLRLGRQQLAFGSQRLVSPLPWANALRTWDGGGATFDVGD